MGKLRYLKTETNILKKKQNTISVSLKPAPSWAVLSDSTLPWTLVETVTKQYVHSEPFVFITSRQ